MRTMLKTGDGGDFRGRYSRCVWSRERPRSACRWSPPTWKPSWPQTDGQFIDASFAEPGSEADRIVGFCDAKFVSEGTSGIPDGTVIDTPNAVAW